MRRWTYTHNTTGGPVQVVATEAGTTHTLNVETSPQHGQVTALTASNGTAAQFSYDARGKPRTAQLPDWSATFEHDARSLLQEVRFGSGAWVRLIYDAAGVPVRVEDSSGVSQVIAGLDTSSTGGPSSGTSRRLAGVVASIRVAAINAQRKQLVDWLPLGSAQAQLPAPFLFPGIALRGLSHATSAAGIAADGGVHGCCDEASQTIARALERRVQEVTAPWRLAGYAAQTVVNGLSNDLLILRSTERLRASMCRELGIARQRDKCAHHIVAVSARYSPSVALSQSVLTTFGLHVDSGYNGVYLDCRVHRALHSGTLSEQEIYHKAVYEFIRSSASRDELILRLRTIALELERSGTFIFPKP